MDLSPECAAAPAGIFRVNDRVERLKGNSEQAHWGTITSVVAERGDVVEWLVVDNAGVTHTDRAADLSLAVRGVEWSRSLETARG